MTDKESRIAPEKITKPIQLLGAWLVGLLSIDCVFLLTATRMDAGTWQSGALTIAAILNVPIFIVALFLLQTKFRPELQEDAYYSTYLSSLTNEPIKLSKKDATLREIEEKIRSLDKRSLEAATAENTDTALNDLSFGINIHLTNRENIFKKLSGLGVVGYSEFGEDVTPPDILKVAYSPKLPVNKIDEILKISQELGFTHYGTYESYEEIHEDVLFGAYGDQDLRKIIPA